MSATRQISATIKQHALLLTRKISNPLSLSFSLSLSLSLSFFPTAMVNPASSLPPGFRFHPTDEELILHYLRNRATSSPCPVSIIAEVDIYKFDPWDLPAKATFGEREWYFFSPRDRKYPNGARPNRAAVSGYWKATGTDKPILTTAGNQNIGVKKALVFYKGRPPRGTKTNWIMHEYRLADSTHINKPIRLKESMRLDDWVLCRIYRKSNHLPRTMDQEQEPEEDPCIEDVLASLPNVTNQQTLKLHKSSSISDFLIDAADYSLLARLMYENSNSNADPQQHTPTIGYATNPSEPLNTNGAWSLQKLPRLENLLSENREFKRQRLVGNPQVGVFPSAIFNESTNQFGYPHYHQLPNQPLLNQQIPLNPQFEFQ